MLWSCVLRYIYMVCLGKKRKGINKYSRIFIYIYVLRTILFFLSPLGVYIYYVYIYNFRKREEEKTTTKG